MLTRSGRPIQTSLRPISWVLSLQRASPEPAAVAKRLWAAPNLVDFAARIAACYRVNVGNSLTADWLVSVKLLGYRSVMSYYK